MVLIAVPNLNKRALVVEPSRDLRELICEILHAQHFDVDGVADASNIVPSKKPYAVVIADLPSGEMASHFAEALGARLPSLKKHLVLMSGWVEHFDEPRGEVPLLVKPFDRQSLLASIAEVSER